MNTRARWAPARRPAAGPLALLAACGLLAGCVSPTDPLDRRGDLEKAQRRYTELIRWGEVEKASRFVDPELVDEFLALAGTMGNLRITDFETGEIQFADDAAVVAVTYRGYAVSEFIERTAREEQDWYRDGGLTDPWRVRPQLRRVVATLRGEDPETAGR